GVQTCALPISAQEGDIRQPVPARLAGAARPTPPTAPSADDHGFVGRGLSLGGLPGRRGRRDQGFLLPGGPVQGSGLLHPPAPPPGGTSRPAGWLPVAVPAHLTPAGETPDRVDAFPNSQ